MKIAQLECLHAHPSSSDILLASFRMTTRYAITIRTPIEFPNGDQTLWVRGTHAYVCGYYKSNDETSYLLATPSNITKKRDEHSYSLMSYFDIKRSFLICSRDKADRHTPILIEDENLFIAFDDLPLDDT